MAKRRLTLSSRKKVAASKSAPKPAPVPMEPGNAAVPPPGPPLMVIQAPMLYASSVQIQNLGSDFNVVFLRTRPVAQGDQTIVPSVVMQEVVCVIQMSAHTLKDISVVLPPVIERFEKDAGKLATPFTKGRAEEAKKEAKKKQITAPSSSKKH